MALIAYGFIVVPRRCSGWSTTCSSTDPVRQWSYTEIRGFGPSLGPWLWFKLYWAAWAVLLAVVARLLWVRGNERRSACAIRLARRRFTRSTAAVAARGGGAHPHAGRFHLLQHQLLKPVSSAASESQSGAPSTSDVWTVCEHCAAAADRDHPSQSRSIPSGARRRSAARTVLVNESRAGDRLHPRGHGAEWCRDASGNLRPDSVARARRTTTHGYRIYALTQPLAPGDTLRLSFEVHVAPHGFGNRGADAFVVPNGRHFTNQDWLPAVGYQRNRELKVSEFEDGLDSPRPAVPSLDDAVARRIRVGGVPIDFDAIVGTSGDQIAVAPGTLRRTWTEAVDATSITSRMYPPTISMACSPPGTRCTKNSGIPRRGQGRPSRFRSSITLGIPGIWAA